MGAAELAALRPRRVHPLHPRPRHLRLVPGRQAPLRPGAPQNIQGRQVTVTKLAAEELMLLLNTLAIHNLRAFCSKQNIYVAVCSACFQQALEREEK